MAKVGRRELLRNAASAGLGLGLFQLVNIYDPFGLARGQDAFAAGNASLTVWKGPQSPKDEEFFNQRILRFHQQNPNISGSYKVAPWNTLTASLTAAFAARKSPDIVYLPQSFYPRYAAVDQLVDLSSVGSAETNMWKKVTPPEAWATGQYKGKWYGLIFLKGGTTLVWNKKLFQAAGLDPNEAPPSWKDLRAFAEKLTKRDAAGRTTQWGYGIMDNTENLMLNFVPVALMNYGGAFTTFDNKRWIANSGGYVQGLDLQVQIMRSDKTAPPFGTFVGSSITNAFFEGNVALLLTTTAFIQALLPKYPGFDIGVGHTPAGPANNWTIGGYGYWFMSAQCPYRSEAWQLMQYLAGTQLVTDYANTTGREPGRSDAKAFENDPLEQAFVRADTRFGPQPVLPFDFWSMLMPQCEAALSGQTSAKDALDTAAQMINQRIQQGG
jgi:ABC-type glycerol-3-phosphate transport system substrate-binding protein